MTIEEYMASLRRGAVSARAAAGAWRNAGELELALQADALADAADRMARDDEPTQERPESRR